MQNVPHLYQLISKNKRYSFLLIMLITALFVAVGYFIGAAYANPFIGIFFAFAVSLVMALTSYFAGDSIVLGLMGAEEADRAEYPQLYNVVEEMKIASGLPMPKVYVIHSAASNAFATGRNPKNASIAVTTGILELLKRDELQAVIGHEMSHIRNYDTLYAVIMGIMVGAIAIACDSFWRMLRWGRLGGRSRGRGAGQAQAVILLIAIILAILAPIAAKIIQFAMSRRREYLADNGSAELTRNPEALASALEKIAGDPDPLDVANRGVQHLFIINPLHTYSGDTQWLVGLFSTHPPVMERVRILKGLAHTYIKDKS
ncbi:MAG: hypothetical protein A2W23_01790 [Planctomycetes bacterium RBG_16_43_13]|nr:MAG: hypothetical protein A2W23_01790 [Planctomycetes bacterium RBG_16_43_13]